MGVVVKFSYVDGAHRYDLRISGDDAFQEDLDVLTYYHDTGDVSFDYYVKSVYDRLDKEIHGEDSDSEIVSVHEIDRSLFCAVSGTIVTPSGNPAGNVMVDAHVHSSDEPSNDDSSYYRTPSEVTETTDLGKFTMFLRRGLRFVLRVPQLGYKLWFMVPDQDNLDLKDAEGTSLPILNPF